MHIEWSGFLGHLGNYCFFRSVALDPNQFLDDGVNRLELRETTRILSCRRITTSDRAMCFPDAFGTLAAAAERGPVDFPELLLTPGVGARTVRSLAMVAEVVHGAPYRVADPLAA